jgi:ABC-type dipeptide/oligopeptide/nickel transport system ATPase component
VPDNREDILLKIKNLTVALKRSDNTTLSILDNINLSLNREQRVAIIGQSGSGKTITSRAILGLLPENMRIISGRISFDNKNITIDNESALEDLRGEKIAMIFQEPHAALNPVFRIETQLTDVIRTNLKLSKKSAKEKALNILLQVGFSNAQEIFKMYPGQLSGGMAQRVLIAMALSCQPELIIADEPTSALDAITQTKILKLIFDLQEKYQFALLIISHDIPLIKKYVNDVYILKDGKIIYSGAINDIAYPNPDPYIQSLFETLPDVV